MTNLPYSQTFSEYTNFDYGNTSSKNVNTESLSVTHEDIPEFLFAPLDEVKKDLLDSGRSPEEVESVIAGLSQLPEYATSKRIINGKRTN